MESSLTLGVAVIGKSCRVLRGLLLLQQGVLGVGGMSAIIIHSWLYILIIDFSISLVSTPGMSIFHV